MKPMRRVPVCISTVLVCLCGHFGGCIFSNGFSVTHAFHYPQILRTSPPYWDYSGLVEIWDVRAEKKVRRVDIVAGDGAKKQFLKDTLFVTGKSVNDFVIWKDFEHIHILFYEGPVMRDSEIDKVTPDMILREVDYVFDKNTGRFQRSK
jgi:hypothetical protein